MSLIFKPVTTDTQIAELAKLAREIWYGYWPAIIGQEQTEYMVNKFQSEPAIKRDMTENAYEYWFLVEDDPNTFPTSRADNIVGFTGGHIHAETNRFFISKIYLLPDARGRGYCSRVIEFYETLCQARNLSAMYLTVNKNNQLGLRAYRANDFYVAEEIVLEIGDGYVMDDYIMQKDVNQTGKSNNSNTNTTEGEVA